MSNKIFTDALSDETLAKLTDDMLNHENINKNKSKIKINHYLFRIIPAVGAIVLVIGLINILTVFMNGEAEPDDVGTSVENNNEYDFIKCEINIDSYTISLELPKRISGQDYMTGSGELFYEAYIKGNENFEKNNAVITDSNARLVGIVELVDFEDIPDEQFEYYKESPEQNYRALYFQLPMGSMNSWGTDYKIVYGSDDWREGAATDLVYYRSDFLENYGLVDFSHFKEEIIEGDPRTGYYNKGVLGYNLDLNKFVKIEMYYDAVTDEELRHIAETLIITGDGEETVVILEENKDDKQEYYTYEEYIEYRENDKALLLSLIDCIDENWMPVSGEPVLTQEIYDKVMTNWEINTKKTLEEIKNGVTKVPKLPQNSYPYAVYDTMEPRLDLKCRIENGKWVLYNYEDIIDIMETFDTKDEMLERARWWLSRAVLAGEIDMAQANTVYRRLYFANDNEIDNLSVSANDLIEVDFGYSIYGDIVDGENVVSYAEITAIIFKFDGIHEMFDVSDLTNLKLIIDGEERKFSLGDAGRQIRNEGDTDGDVYSLFIQDGDGIKKIYSTRGDYYKGFILNPQGSTFNLTGNYKGQPFAVEKDMSDVLDLHIRTIQEPQPTEATTETMSGNIIE